MQYDSSQESVINWGSIWKGSYSLMMMDDLKDKKNIALLLTLISPGKSIQMLRKIQDLSYNNIKDLFIKLFSTETM